jgi:hypothetical protein
MMWSYFKAASSYRQCLAIGQRSWNKLMAPDMKGCRRPYSSSGLHSTHCRTIDWFGSSSRVVPPANGSRRSISTRRGCCSHSPCQARSGQISWWISLKDSRTWGGSVVLTLPIGYPNTPTSWHWATHTRPPALPRSSSNRWFSYMVFRRQSSVTSPAQCGGNYSSSVALNFEQARRSTYRLTGSRRSPTASSQCISTTSPVIGRIASSVGFRGLSTATTRPTG